MAEIERYDPVMGTRLYLCITDDNQRHWTDRFYSSELPDDEAERLATEMTPRLTIAGFVVEVLY